jgi:hypothetical protein
MRIRHYNLPVRVEGRTCASPDAIDTAFEGRALFEAIFEVLGAEPKDPKELNKRLDKDFFQCRVWRRRRPEIDVDAIKKCLKTGKKIVEGIVDLTDTICSLKKTSEYRDNEVRVWARLK